MYVVCMLGYRWIRRAYLHELRETKTQERSLKAVILEHARIKESLLYNMGMVLDGPIPGRQT